MSSFMPLFVKAGGLRWYAIIGRHAINRRSIRCRSEKNHILLTPCAALPIRRYANIFGRAAGNRNPFEHALAEKTDILAVRRPERMPSVFRILKLLRLRLIKRIEPDVIYAFFLSGNGNEPSVRRNCRRTSLCVGTLCIHRPGQISERGAALD